MKNTFNIEGMTCNSCKAKVTESIQKIKGVSTVEVDLDLKKAAIVSNRPLSLAEVQKAVPDKYTVSEKSVEKNIFNSVSKENEDSDLKKLYPLFLIFGYITVASFLLNMKPWSAEGFMLDFMGLFYLVFSFFKILDIKGFPESFKMYDPLAKILPIYGWVYPFIETLLAIQFLMRFEIEIALVITLIILGITTIGVTKVLLDKKSIQCACLGTALKLPMTKATFIENTIMLIMALWMLYKIYA